jgi:uncharacterized integral membrane protein
MLRKRNTAAGAGGTARTNYASTGIWPAVVTGILLAVAVVVFVAQNAHQVALEFLWVDFRTSPGVLVLATAVLAVAATEIVGAAVRHRRRRQLAEREELQRLRATSTPPGAASGGEVDLGREERREEPRTIRG